MFRPNLRRLAEASRSACLINPHQAQKEWPPDFTKLHPKYQFHLERKYRRRAKLRYARPRWTKAVKIAASGSSLLILVYAVFFMDWEDMARGDAKPFERTRQWVRNEISSIWTASPTTSQTIAQKNDSHPKPAS